MSEHNNRVDGRLKAGAVEVEIHCDASQLDEALRKMNLLIQKADVLQGLGVLPVGIVTAGLIKQAETHRVSRRGFLGFGWRRP